MIYAHIFKKWNLAAWKASAEARKAAISKNHEVAAGVAMHMKSVGKDNHKEINNHMIKQGYIPSGTEGGLHMYTPLTPDTEKPNHPPENPVLGHNVQIAINHKTGTASAISHYS